MTTTRTRIERAGDALLSTLLGAAVEGIVIIDSDASIQLFSTGAQKLFGYEPEEVIGRNVNVLMPEPYHSQHDGYMHRYMDTGEARIIGSGREVAARHKNGEVFPIDLSVGKAELEDDLLFVGIMRDLRERTSLQRELSDQREHAVELERRLTHVHRISTLGEMAAGIAHEINQPLSAIATYADAGLRIVDSAEPSLDKLGYAMRCVASQARRAGDVVQRMRDLARENETPRALMSINDVLRDLLILIELEARESDAPIHLDLDETVPPVSVDPVQIQQIVINLVRNGLESIVKRSQAERGIRIISRQDADKVQVVVIDHGEGVPADKVDKIFHPFETSKPHGMGIGLSICKTIAQRHGGRLWYEPNPGGGSQFLFSLPVQQESQS